MSAPRPFKSIMALEVDVDVRSPSPESVIPDSQPSKAEIEKEGQDTEDEEAGGEEEEEDVGREHEKEMVGLGAEEEAEGEEEEEDEEEDEELGEAEDEDDYDEEEDENRTIEDIQVDRPEPIQVDDDSNEKDAEASEVDEMSVDDNTDDDEIAQISEQEDASPPKIDEPEEAPGIILQAAPEPLPESPTKDTPSPPSSPHSQPVTPRDIQEVVVTPIQTIAPALLLNTENMVAPISDVESGYVHDQVIPDSLIGMPAPMQSEYAASLFPLPPLPPELNRKKRKKDREKGSSAGASGSASTTMDIARWESTLIHNPVSKHLRQATKCLSTPEWMVWSRYFRCLSCCSQSCIGWDTRAEGVACFDSDQGDASRRDLEFPSTQKTEASCTHQISLGLCA